MLLQQTRSLVENNVCWTKFYKNPLKEQSNQLIEPSSIRVLSNVILLWLLGQGNIGNEEEIPPA
jgi:hypothetical protein